MLVPNVIPPYASTLTAPLRSGVTARRQFRFWPKADILIAWANVCFSGVERTSKFKSVASTLIQSGHWPVGVASP